MSSVYTQARSSGLLCGVRCLAQEHLGSNLGSRLAPLLLSVHFHIVVHSWTWTSYPPVPKPSLHWLSYCRPAKQLSCTRSIIIMNIIFQSSLDHWKYNTLELEHQGINEKPGAWGQKLQKACDNIFSFKTTNDHWTQLTSKCDTRKKQKKKKQVNWFSIEQHS